MANRNVDGAYKAAQKAFEQGEDRMRKMPKLTPKLAKAVEPKSGGRFTAKKN